MGYEVLDSGGPARPGLAGPRPGGGPRAPGSDVYDLGVYDLGAMLPPPATVAYAQDVRPRVTHVLTRRRWLAVGGALVTLGAFGGALLGVAVGTRQADQARQAVDRAAVEALAYASEVTGYVGVGGQTALLRVQLTNLGPLPVDVVTSPLGVQAAPGRPVVRQYGTTSAVAPGADLDVLMTVVVRCRRGTDVTDGTDGTSPSNPGVPVRTADGRVHQVPIRSRAGELDVATACLSSGR